MEAPDNTFHKLHIQTTKYLISNHMANYAKLQGKHNTACQFKFTIAYFLQLWRHLNPQA